MENAEELRSRLVEHIEAFATARSTGSRLLQLWAARELTGVLNAIKLAPLEEAGKESADQARE